MIQPPDSQLLLFLLHRMFRCTANHTSCNLPSLLPANNHKLSSFLASLHQFPLFPPLIFFDMKLLASTAAAAADDDDDPGILYSQEMMMMMMTTTTMLSFHNQWNNHPFIHSSEETQSSGGNPHTQSFTMTPHIQNKTVMKMKKKGKKTTVMIILITTPGGSGMMSATFDYKLTFDYKPFFT